MLDQISRFYESYDEDGRLFRDNVHLPEYLTTIRYFNRLLMPGSRILDACAGTGRYSFYLSDKGHTVTACDLVEHNVDIIRAKPGADKLASISVCNVLDLSRFQENSFDAVLCMGALYHLNANDLREKAVSECTRICIPGGIVIIAYIVQREDDSDMSGHTYVPDAYRDVFFGSAPHEIEGITTKCGLKKLHNIGTDGIIYNIGSRLKEASDKEFLDYMEDYYLTCEAENNINVSCHGLWIGRKK